MQILPIFQSGPPIITRSGHAETQGLISIRVARKPVQSLYIQKGTSTLMPPLAFVLPPPDHRREYYKGASSVRSLFAGWWADRNIPTARAGQESNRSLFSCLLFTISFSLCFTETLALFPAAPNLGERVTSSWWVDSADFLCLRVMSRRLWSAGNQSALIKRLTINSGGLKITLKRIEWYQHVEFCTKLSCCLWKLN